MEALLVIARAAHYAAAIVLFGEAAFRLFVSPGRVAPPRYIAIAASALGIAAVSAVAWLAIEARQMSGLPFAEAVAPGTLRTILTQTLFGQLWMLRLPILAAAALSILLLREGRAAAGIAFATSLLFVVSLAGMGHAAASQGADRGLRLAADALHLAAAAAWIGALWPLARVVGEAMRRAEPASIGRAGESTRRFSALGIACVGTLLLSGVVNATFVIHGPRDLYASAYGLLLAAKIALFATMVAFAAFNRFRLTPALVVRPGARVAPSLRQLRRNALAELVLGIAIVCIVAKLGITMPASPRGVE